MTLQEVKRTRLARQFLTRPCDKRSVVRGLCGVQAQFLSNARHALRIRCTEDLSVETWGEGLVKNWTLRGTMHVFGEEDLPLFLYGYPHALRPQDRLEGDAHITESRKRYFAGEILRLIGEGICERGDLKQACFALGMTAEENQSVFDQWGGTIRALAESGAICYRVQEKKAFMLCKPFAPLPQEEAEQELVRRYFTHYAPATLRDASYFLGMTQTKIRGILKTLPVQELESEGKRFFLLEGPETDLLEMPECLLLAGFDPLMLGYEKQESLFLPPEYLRGIFNLSGIVFPAILLRGSVVGKWKREKRRVQLILFEALDRRDRDQAAEAAWRLFGEDVQLHWQEYE
ncbi:MAG: crosslink repair DNA glycosylase YcaQ family protein [Clostridiaceae bacterium]|nr:crosslink repair DNA glycosylase YcaQ family protein [Clostridiaceae bacterium]